MQYNIACGNGCAFLNDVIVLLTLYRAVCVMWYDGKLQIIKYWTQLYK